MQIVIKMVRVQGLEQFAAAVVDTDGLVLHSLVRWSESYARRDATLWANALERSLRV